MKGKVSFNQKNWDVIVIGSGPAGLASAVSAHDNGAKVCIVEREGRVGGILKQCIHDGFGVIRFKETMTGPEYAYRYVQLIKERQIPVFINTFLLNITKQNQKYILTLVNSTENIFYFETSALVLATGCRERTSKQIFIHGTRPSGIFTAGQAQYFINVQGYMPTKRCVILGSGDIGLIMARRLTLEGAQVEGVYEIKSEPSGLMRNVVQCLEDYNIPLYLKSTVVKIHGENRVEGVTVCPVGEDFKPIKGKERYIACDALILSVGLIPENDIAEPLHLRIDPRTKGPIVDQNLMTMKDGIFSCGNALHVNDLVDYVSESGEITGRMAAGYAFKQNFSRKLTPLNQCGDLLYVVPQFLDLDIKNKAVIYFRSSRTLKNVELKIYSNHKKFLFKKYPIVRPPEMKRVILDLTEIPNKTDEIVIELKEKAES